MSEVRAPLGASLPVGSPLRGRLVGQLCHVCTHAHVYAQSSHEGECEFAAACPVCGCTKSGAEYDGTVISLDDYRPRRVDELAAYRSHDDDHVAGELCPVHHLPGRCVELGRRGDARGEGGVEPRERLRGVGELACGRTDLWGRLRDLPSQLGRLWRLRRVRGRDLGDAGSADHDRDADPAGPTGPERL